MPGEKPLGAKERTNNKLNPHLASTPVFEPGPHWWEASALTTAPPLPPKFCYVNVQGGVTRLAEVRFVIHQIRAKFTLAVAFHHYER